MLEEEEKIQQKTNKQMQQTPKWAQVKIYEGKSRHLVLSFINQKAVAPSACFISLGAGKSIQNSNDGFENLGTRAESLDKSAPSGWSK